MGISKNGGNWHLEAFLYYFTCLNLIFVKILGNFQLGQHYYCLTVTGHVLATTSSNEYAKQPTLDFTIHDDTSTNKQASSQRSNILSQRSTSLAQPIKAGFISCHFRSNNTLPPFLLGGCFISWVRHRRSNLIELSSKLFPCLQWSPAVPLQQPCYLGLGIPRQIRWPPASTLIG